MKKRESFFRLFYILACFLLLGQYFGSLTQLQAAGDTASGTDISTVLPADANKTLIDSATASFTDASGKSVDPQSVTSSTNINLAYQWSIPDTLNDGYQLKAGDYFTFQLPEGIAYDAAQKGNLGDYGSYTVSAGGQVTFTFNSNVENKDGVHGTFNYKQTVSQETTGGEHNIVIPTKGEDQTIPYFVTPTGGNAIAKTGTVTPDKQEVIWSVTVNTNLDTLKSAQIIDTMPANTTLVKTVVYPVTVDLKGNVTATGTALTADQDYTVDKNGTITLIGQYADTRQAFKVEYTTTIDAAAVPEDGGSVEFNNTAILRNNEQDAAADASVTVNYGNFLDKKFDGQDNDGGQKYNWHIDYNFNEKQLPENTQLTDQLSDNQTFSGDPTLTYEDGTTVPKDQYQVDYDTAKGKMTITFPQGLTKGVKVAYQSQLIDPNDTTTKISNSASSDGKTVDSGDQPVGQQGLTKTVGTVDYNAKTVAWHLDINMARQDMADWVLTDTVPDGLTLNSDSFVLQDKDTGKTLTNGEDYQITAQEGGFKLEFLGDLKAHAKDWYTLTYTTNFDINKLPANHKWTNKATATWTDQNGASHTNDGQADFTPKTEFINDGSKSGSYNATTKTIQWTVVVNYNQWTLADGAAITDAIVGDQDYVANSAKLATAKIGKDGSYTPGDAVSDPSIQYDATKKTLTASLPKGDSAYVLTYETSLAGKVIDQPTYDNTASYQNGDEKHDLTAKVTVPHSGSVVEKDGQQDPTDSNYALWNIWVNKAQSTLKNVKVVDTPSTDQIIDEASVVVYPTTPAANGDFTEQTDAPLKLGTDYTLAVQTDQSTGAQTLTLEFKNQISSAYSIHYRALINSATTDSVSNAVVVTGDGEKAVNDSTTKDVAVVTSNGSGDGQNTNLVIQKTDVDTKDPLAGASFSLYAIGADGKKGQLLKDGTTDDKGRLAWGNLKSGQYILQETKAPEGYVIADDLAQGKVVTVDYTKADDDNNVTLPETNQQGQVTITKRDDTTQAPLEGAEFSLYQEDGTLVKAGLRTTADGTITYKGLTAGQYYVVETAAPDGYQLDHTTKYPFTISGQKISQQVVVNDAHNPVTVQGTKTWSDQNDQDGVRPAQIVVHLWANGEITPFQKTVTAQDQWQYSFTDLPFYQNGKPVTYTVSEDPVAGYATTMQGFDITNIHTPETTNVTGKKTWQDNNNQDGQRPSQIVVHLLGNGVAAGQQVVTAKDNWHYSFTNLPKYQNGKLITYTVQEDKVPGYATTVKGFDVTNIHTPETTNVSGTKTWQDGNNQDRVRPSQIVVYLLGNGVEVGKQVVTAKNDWQYTFANLPKYRNGKLITYTLREAPVSGYATTIKGFNITNTHVPTPVGPNNEQHANGSKSADGGRSKDENNSKASTSTAHLPQTGEALSDGLMVLGLVLIVGVGVIYAVGLRKRKNDKD